MSGFRRERENLVYSNRWIEFFDDEVTTPSGTEGRYVRLQYRGNPPGVVIAAVAPDSRFLLLELDRYAVARRSLEFPRGCAAVGEDPRTAAARELQEETGLVATSLSHVGTMHPDTAIVATKVEVWRAEIPTADVSQLELGSREGIVSGRFVRRAELQELVAAGELVDGFTLAALSLLDARGQPK